MSTEHSVRWAPPAWKQIRQYVTSGLIISGFLLAGFWGAHLLTPDHTIDLESTDAETAGEAALPSVVTLTPEKQAAAGIRLAPVAYHDLQETITVAATLTYDTTRYVVLKAPVDCVVEQLLAQPGEQVCQSVDLARLTSSEIALARAQVSNSEADLRLAEIQYKWTSETRENLLELLSTLETRPTVAEIESKFNSRVLGSYRDDVLAAYTRLQLASNVVARTRPLTEQGIVAGSTAETRLSQRDEAATAFKSACEQSEYESRRELSEKNAEWDVAKRQFAVAQERLRMLLGPFGEDSSHETGGEFLLRAPFDGRIEVLHTSQSARLEKGEPIMVLADPSRLRVSAMIHQHDWDALDIGNDQILRVSVPAFPRQEFPAQLCFIGPEISPTTRAISLVASIDNSSGQFRPGMFAWVSVPVASARKGLVVPLSAIQHHEGETFVFVSDGTNRFRRVNVETGMATTDYVEIEQGLSEGTEVVDRGAFYIKSELLLEQEAE